jgi:hypothetical protein
LELEIEMIGEFKWKSQFYMEEKVQKEKFH